MERSCAVSILQEYRESFLEFELWMATALSSKLPSCIVLGIPFIRGAWKTHTNLAAQHNRRGVIGDGVNVEETISDQFRAFVAFQLRPLMPMKG